MRTILISILGIFLATTPKAQVPLAGMADSLAYAELPLLSTYDGTKAMASKTSLKSWTPHPGHQTNGACTGYAFAYAALTMQYAQQYKVTDKDLITRSAFSPTYIYNQVKVDPSDCNKGAELTRVAQVMSQRGSCPMTLFDSDDCNLLPSEPHHAVANKYKIKQAVRVYSFRESTKERITAVKRSLNKNLPVVFNFQVYQSFRDLGKGKKYWPGVQRGDNYLGWHVMTVIGYDDELEVFEILSSWGPNWANHGYVLLSYDDFTKHARCPTVLIPDFSNNPFISKPTPVNKSRTQPHKITFTPFKISETAGQWIYEEIRPSRSTSDVYVAQYAMHSDEQIQIEIGDLPEARYIYVFSIDKGHLRQHWPRTPLASSSTYTTTSKEKLIIPNPESVLLPTAPKEEILIVLTTHFPLHKLDILESCIPSQDTSHFSDCILDTLIRHNQAENPKCSLYKFIIQ